MYYLNINSSMRNSNYPRHFAEKYKGIPFVVLDIPPVVMDDAFQEMWNTHNAPIVRLKPDERYTDSPYEAERMHKLTGKLNEYTMPNWNGINIIDSPGADDRWTKPMIDGKNILPKFIDYLHTNIPTNGISQILFWSNQRPIGIHKDKTEQLPYPNSLRIMIQDENPTPTFWLQPLGEGSQGIGAERIPFDTERACYVETRGLESSAFVYNNDTWCHGAHKLQKEDGSFYSKILCSISLSWEWKGYEELLDRSIEKYGNNIK